jgi:transposase
MVFPADHSLYPNQPKGIKAVLTKRGLYRTHLRGKCKNRCEATKCCNKRILELQADFAEQKSLVQETIEASGHLCLFFPKFHCELNFIEFFWTQVKKYLCDNCDYIFDTLKENMPKALESVSLTTIRQWEHRMYRWMEAYRSGLGTSAAQLQVKRFGSAKYKSHRWVLEAVARAFD